MFGKSVTLVFYYKWFVCTQLIIFTLWKWKILWKHSCVFSAPNSQLFYEYLWYFIYTVICLKAWLYSELVLGLSVANPNQMLIFPQEYLCQKWNRCFVAHLYPNRHEMFLVRRTILFWKLTFFFLSRKSMNLHLINYKIDSMSWWPHLLDLLISL